MKTILQRVWCGAAPGAGLSVFQLPAGGQGAVREQSRGEIPNQAAAAPASSPRQRGTTDGGVL